MIEGRETSAKTRTIKYGMVGGGTGSFIGDVHRKAAAFDGRCEIVAGCFSRDYDATLVTGQKLGLDQGRIYKNFKEMASKEGARSDGIEFVTICTPNYAHYDIAKAFMEQGIHIVCDKPLATTIEQAEDLARTAKANDLLFMVTYSYSGYAILRHAREMVRRGDIGDIRVVIGEYPQGWLAENLEATGQKQASWRTNPELAGVSNCVGDIGSHVENTAAFITGLEIDSVCANLEIFGEDRTLDTNGEIMLKYKGGGSGMYWTSQIAIGNDNGLRVRVCGTKGTIDFVQERPNDLQVAFLGGPVQTLTRGNGYLYPEAQALSRIPSGHPEGYNEGFANLYTKFADALNKKQAGDTLTDDDLDFPNADDGVRGVNFIHRCVESSKNGSVWTKLD